MHEKNGWDKETDLLVLGGGAAGMTAALVACFEGLEPLLVEKTDQVGGTMSTSAGTIWIPGNTQSLQAGYNDSVNEARCYLDTLIGTPDDTEIREVYLQTAPEMVDYLRARSDVQFAPCGKHPDYRDMKGAAVVGRGLAPVPFDGRLLGKDFERVRPPIPEFMVLGGMMAGKTDIPRLINRFRSFSDFLYSGRLFLRYITDRMKYSRGTRVVMGNALAARLYYSLKKNKVPVLFETQVESLIKEQGRVIGAVLRTNGSTQRVRARRGVVIATGGYGHNQALRQLCMPTPTPPYSLACVGNTGDGIELGRQNNGYIRPETQGPGAFWTPVSVVNRPDGSRGLYPHLSLDRAKPGLIAVNSAGRRFVNEADSYHDFVEGMYKSNQSVPTMPCYLVCESDFVRRYGLGAVYPGTTNLAPAVKSGYLVQANTIKELARCIKVPEQELVQTIERYNALARSGVDSDFGKGSTELNRFNGDPEQKPNPCLRPIEHGPFVAVAVWPAEIGTSTGLVSNPDGQVLDEQGLPIAGLYVAGNDMASIMMGTYPGPGTTLGPALTFAYRAARHTAKVSSAGQGTANGSKP